MQARVAVQGGGAVDDLGAGRDEHVAEVDVLLRAEHEEPQLGWCMRRISFSSAVPVRASTLKRVTALAEVSRNTGDWFSYTRTGGRMPSLGPWRAADTVGDHTLAELVQRCSCGRG